ncbi:MAG: cupin domain-containing protein [Desulfobulbia bacterium]
MERSARELFHNLYNPEGGIKRKLAEGMETTIFVGDNVMVSLVKCEPFAKGQEHSHGQEQWGVLIEGSGKRLQNGETVEVAKGDIWQTPGGVKHGFEAGPDGAFVLDIFSPPRDEYKVAGQGFEE